MAEAVNPVLPDYSLQLTSTLRADGMLTIELTEQPIAQPSPGELVIQIEACPINPADLLMLMPATDLNDIQFGGTEERPVLTAQLAPERQKLFARRLNYPLPIGLEGAGTVVAAGKGAEHFLGRRVAAMTLRAGMFSQYRTVGLAECVALPDDVTASQGAATFSNPLTALAIIETLHQDGHKALIHTAAASNLGQMLARICAEDGIALVAVVRTAQQVELMQKLGVVHVCNSSSPSFRNDLIKAVAETGARVAFDAIGGGNLVHQLLSAMEAANAAVPGADPFGSWGSKQVYIYGRLDKSLPYVNPGEYGGVWGIGGWAMTAILQKAGSERRAALLQRVVSNLTTTFASNYAGEVSLEGMLKRENMLAYCRQATGEKFLVKP